MYWTTIFAAVCLNTDLLYYVQAGTVVRDDYADYEKDKRWGTQWSSAGGDGRKAVFNEAKLRGSDGYGASVGNFAHGVVDNPRDGFKKAYTGVALIPWSARDSGSFFKPGREIGYGYTGSGGLFSGKLDSFGRSRDNYGSGRLSRAANRFGTFGYGGGPSAKDVVQGRMAGLQRPSVAFKSIPAASRPRSGASNRLPAFANKAGYSRLPVPSPIAAPRSGASNRLPAFANKAGYGRLPVPRPIAAPGALSSSPSKDVVSFSVPAEVLNEYARNAKQAARVWANQVQHQARINSARRAQFATGGKAGYGQPSASRTRAVFVGARGNKAAALAGRAGFGYSARAATAAKSSSFGCAEGHMKADPSSNAHFQWCVYGRYIREACAPGTTFCAQVQTCCQHTQYADVIGVKSAAGAASKSRSRSKAVGHGDGGYGQLGLGFGSQSGAAAGYGPSFGSSGYGGHQGLLSVPGRALTFTGPQGRPMRKSVGTGGRLDGKGFFGAGSKKRKQINVAVSVEHKH